MDGKMSCMVLWLGTILLLQLATSSESTSFRRSREPIPSVFLPGLRYPDRNETDECRPIRLRISRNSRLYRTQLVTNSNSKIDFLTADSRIMTSRLQTRLDALAERYYAQYSARIRVLRSWSDYSPDESDSIGDPDSLHYEGTWLEIAKQLLLHN